MTIENPNKNLEQEIVVFRERYKRVKERLVELKHLTESRGLSSNFIHNVIGNILARASMTLELFELEEGTDVEMKVVVEESLGLAEKYLDTLNENEEALQAETSMSFDTWSKMGQQEYNHAREIVAKYGTRQ